MSRLQNHLDKYERFKTAANLPGMPAEGVIELLFLASFHLIDACAAKHRVHINKHQNVRRELQTNPFIFGEATEFVWTSFQQLEGELRSKFVYGSTGTEEDLRTAREVFARLEEVCLEVLK